MSERGPQRTTPKGTPVRVGRYGPGGRSLHAATPEEFARAKEAEKARQAVDPNYITAEQAAPLTPEQLEADPSLRARVGYSAASWPENRLSPTRPGADLPGGQGECIERRTLDAGEVFTGRRMGD